MEGPGATRRCLRFVKLAWNLTEGLQASVWAKTPSIHTELLAHGQSTEEDGTAKIPCPKGYGCMSITRQKANHHAKNASCSAKTAVGPTCNGVY
jgi:hypothetical protein